MDKNLSIPPPLVKIDPDDEEISNEVFIEFLLQENFVTQFDEEARAEIDTNFKNNDNYSNSTINNNTKKCVLKLTADEISERITKLPEHKMKSGLNMSGLSPEEIETLQSDSKGSTRYFKTVYNTAKKFFIILMSSDQHKLIAYTEIVHDRNGNETYYFHIYFKEDRCPIKKEELNDCLRIFLFYCLLSHVLCGILNFLHVGSEFYSRCVLLI